MKKSPLVGLLVAGAVALALLPSSTHAIPIQGTLDLTGTATLNNKSLLLATATTGYSGVAADEASTGVYDAAGAAHKAVTMKNFNWAVPTIINPLWSFTYLGYTYQFNLSSLSVVTHTSTFLNLVGEGVATVTAGSGKTLHNVYDPTSGDWTFTISSASGKNSKMKFGFQSSTTVPDGGSTAMLLGLAFLSLGAVARLKAA